MSFRPGLLSAGVAAALAFCAVAGGSAAESPARPRFVEDEIAGIRLGVDRSEEIVRLYGHGFKTPAHSQEERYCYWDERRQLGVQFRLSVGGVVDGVNVAEVPEQIDKACRAANLKVSQPLTTGKMIALGDSLETVLGVYGEPGNRVDGVARGRRFVALEYEARVERTPGVARWYWAALLFFDAKLAGFQVLESSESVGKALRRGTR
jgi:hypothetical protein